MKHTLTTAFFILVAFLLCFFGVKEIKYFVLVGFVWSLIVFWGSAFIGSNYHVKTYCGNPLVKEKKIALTFDDGPHEMTLLVLDVLKKYNAKATFFCIGKNIETHPEILKKVIEEGHTVGNHTYSHSRFFDFYRKSEVIAEIKQTDALIESVLGKKTNLFRPPYGVTNPSIRRALAVTKHKTIGWNIRSFDGGTKNKKFILNRIIKRIKPGGIVLLHDTSIQTVSVLKQLLLYLGQNNYSVVPLEELLNIKAYED
ncbi:polysaccharide deacetylase family protein [Flavobacterium granuli]|uniref:Peptidoglycan/xylan/chitin deacetylase (PgdA/CDA1 family) n=1 Tax=Flavobacterium granuli TaxID=280093 RepID=A0ABU1RYF5_9FLAO|nr:polysaccharide deacetylase family protein [Flavobacterium granuli]MDR6843390.1 peptidoglycan/xylan/chitin deacetylase (PgdA/CDA1 family) [Flavobacterium granuli]